MTRYDLIIVGGGPVGLSLSVAMARYLPGIKIAIVDRRAVSVPKDARASAIARGVRTVFDTLDVWEDMVGEANPITDMKITDSGVGDISRPLFLQFDTPADASSPYAHMVPNSTSARALIKAVQGLVDFIEPSAVKSLDVTPAKAVLTLESGKIIEAPLVIGADGGFSHIRQLSGIKVFERAYNQNAIVTNISHAVAHDNVAFEHFRPAGPFASLPLQGKRSSLVWCEAPKDAAEFVKKPHDELASMIEAVMGSTLGAVAIEGDVQTFPLSLRIAKDFIAPRVALIGDAAHVIHPIAGQGLNLGLKDVAVLAEVLVEAIRVGEDYGSEQVLERYQRARRLDVSLMGFATDSLNRMFSNDVAVVRAVRDFGLSMVDRMGPLKHAIIDHAAGSSGAKLLRGIDL